MLEKEFQKKVLLKLRLINQSFWYKANDRNRIGIPDIIGCIEGRFYALELKVNSPVTRIQEVTLNQIRQAGAAAFVVTPENFEVVYDTLSLRTGIRKQASSKVSADGVV